MGRKKIKKKQVDQAETTPPVVAVPDPSSAAPVESTPQPPVAKLPAGDDAIIAGSLKRVSPTVSDHKTTPASSGYSMKSHGAEIVAEDLYMSDGSDDQIMLGDDGEPTPEPEVVLNNSRMGLMRRGLHHPSMLVQPNRLWQRADAPNNADAEAGDQAAQEEEKARVEKELAKLDPVERAARLLAEKQRKLEEAKETARRLESEENAGRDPCLFSKRTAFDIRMDQIEDKPWLRGAGALTDFFNYGFTEDDWLDYSQQQLTIRQEVTDAHRQKRPPDPNIVPVSQRAPKAQNPRVAVVKLTGTSNSADAIGENDAEAESGSVIGPAMVEPEESHPMDVEKDGKDITEVNKDDVKHVGAGGAWGAGAAPGSKLARLIEEQERGVGSNPPPRETMLHDKPSGGYDRVDTGNQDGGHPRSRGGYDHADGSHGGGGYHSYDDYRPHGDMAPPPPQNLRGRGGYGGRGGPPPQFGYGGRSGPRYPPPQHGWGQRGGRGGDFPPPSRKRYRDEYRR